MRRESAILPCLIVNGIYVAGERMALPLLRVGRRYNRGTVLQRQSLITDGGFRCSTYCCYRRHLAPSKHFLFHLFYDIITTMSLVCRRSAVWGTRVGAAIAILEWLDRPRGRRLESCVRIGKSSRQLLSNEPVS